MHTGIQMNRHVVLTTIMKVKIDPLNGYKTGFGNVTGSGSHWINRNTFEIEKS